MEKITPQRRYYLKNIEKVKERVYLNRQLKNNRTNGNNIETDRNNIETEDRNK